jgi:hypothetical protein
MTSGLYNFTLLDIIIIIILLFLLVKVVITSIEIYSNLNDFTKNKEGFTTSKNKLLKISDINSKIKVIFPGKYSSTIYRQPTIPEKSLQLVYRLSLPYINLLNVQQKKEYVFNRLIFFNVNEYIDGTIYYLSIIVSDMRKNISQIMNLEIAISKTGLINLNNLSFG